MHEGGFRIAWRDGATRFFDAQGREVPETPARPRPAGKDPLKDLDELRGHGRDLVVADALTAWSGEPMDWEYVLAGVSS